MSFNSQELVRTVRFNIAKHGVKKSHDNTNKPTHMRQLQEKEKGEFLTNLQHFNHFQPPYMGIILLYMADQQPRKSFNSKVESSFVT